MVEIGKLSSVPAQAIKGGEGWTLINGDCVSVVSELADESVGFSVFSPPFASLYTYSDDERDMGNCLTHEEFFEHFDYLVPELFRVTQTGRLCSFHCMNLPLSKERDGVIGLRDFRGKLIAAFEKHGWVMHSEVCIWKDPVTAMQRTKAIGLLHKQVRKDSCMSRQGIADYLVTMGKRGVNKNPVAGLFEDWIGDPSMRPVNVTQPVPIDYSATMDDPEDTELTAPDAMSVRRSIDIWQRYASPVWMDIDPGDTLQYTHARSDKDERHICPLQLGVIRRSIELWTNPGDVVLSPFAGIGSEGYVAVQDGRRFIGVELKPEYFEWAVRNLKHAESTHQPSLFDAESVA